MIIPWLILTTVLLLAILGMIVERAVSGYLNRKSSSELKTSFEALRTSQERGFAQLGLIQKDLFVALKLSYKAAQRAYELAREEMRITNGQMGLDLKDDATDEWAEVVGDKEPEDRL